MLVSLLKNTTSAIKTVTDGELSILLGKGEELFSTRNQVLCSPFSPYNNFGNNLLENWDVNLRIFISKNFKDVKPCMEQLYGKRYFKFPTGNSNMISFGDEVVWLKVKEFEDENRNLFLMQFNLLKKLRNDIHQLPFETSNTLSGSANVNGNKNQLPRLEKEKVGNIAPKFFFHEDTGNVEIKGKIIGSISPHTIPYYFFLVLYRNKNNPISFREIYDSVNKQKKMVTKDPSAFCHTQKSKICKSIPEIEKFIQKNAPNKNEGGYILSEIG